MPVFRVTPVPFLAHQSFSKAQITLIEFVYRGILDCDWSSCWTCPQPLAPNLQPQSITYKVA